MGAKMNFREFIKQLVRMYFVIYTGSMVGTVCFCSIFVPDAHLNVSFITWMFLFALFADLPGLVFYSRQELSAEKWRKRMGLHLLLLEAVLLTAGRMYKMWSGIFQGICFGGIVFGVYVLVMFVNYQLDNKVAEQLNERIQERRKREI